MSTLSIQSFPGFFAANEQSLTLLLIRTTGDATVSRKITYPGMNNKSEFTYGPTGGRVKIVETVSGSVTSTKQFVSAEERDGSGSVTKQFFARGLKDGATKYYYSKDHLASIRTMTDEYGVIQGSYSFDPYGQRTKLEGAQDSDFGFAGMYFHARSGLNFTRGRPYSPRLGRWITRDPIAEDDGTNLFAYVGNSTLNYRDPSGLFSIGFPTSPQAVIVYGAILLTWYTLKNPPLITPVGGYGSQMSDFMNCMAKKKKKGRTSKQKIVAITPQGTPIGEHAAEQMEDRGGQTAAEVDRAIERGPIGENKDFEGGKVYHDPVSDATFYTDGDGTVVTVTHPDFSNL